MGPDQQIIFDAIKKHFNVKDCYNIENFVIDVYFEDLDLYVIFKNREFIIKNNPKFGRSKETFIKLMEDYESAFKQVTGKQITYVFVDELIKKTEEDLIRFFSEEAKTSKKIKGEFFV